MKRYATAEEALRQVFGYETFRGFQKDVIDTVTSGRDALVLMPTGGGKSLCYQVPALLLDGVVVVVSPLIALMQDQVDALEEVGVGAAYLNSTLCAQEIADVKSALRRGELDLLYIAPERLMLPQTLAFLDGLNVSLFAIDEAHCVSVWGHDFRPEYGALSQLRERFPNTPRIALTATAEQHTREEIAQKLLIAPKEFVASFDRPNIFYRIVEKGDVYAQLLAFIKNEHAGEAGVVYCLARRTTEAIASYLQSFGIKALPYHAGLSAEERSVNQARFLREDGIVMVATIAFGMGIDKPNVRFVAHVDMPKSIEGYFQETGRAGRDGEPADAWMAYGLADVVNQRFFIDKSQGDETYRALSTQKLDAMLGLAECPDCRRVRLLAYFGEKSEACGHCDNCVNPPALFNATVDAQKLVSCIYRCQQASHTSFGAKHIIDVLCATMTERVAKFEHDRISTWGIGKHLLEPQWRAIIRQLIARHVLWIDVTRNTLRLGQEASRLLKGEITVYVRKRVVEEQKKGVWKAHRKGSATSEQRVLSARDQSLFDELREWRRDTASAIGKPAYVVFSDATLTQIARQRPASLEELRFVSGVGERKIEKYGDDVLDIVAAH